MLKRKTLNVASQEGRGGGQSVCVGGVSKTEEPRG